MPSIAKAVGLIFVVANPTWLGAQTAGSNHPSANPSRTSSIGYSFSAGQNGGLAAAPMRAAAAGGPQAGLSPGGKPAGGAFLRTASGVVPAGYDAPSSAADHPAASGRTVPPSGETGPGVPLAPRGRQSPLPLPPPGRSPAAQPGRNRGLTSVVTVAGSLAIVLGAFFLVAWGMRRAAPAGATALPNEVFEVLGRAPMAGRQQVHLLRCGRKLVLVSVTPTGAETLTEITDPVEVDRLAGLCRQAHPQSATAAFREVFGQLASGRPGAGLFGRSRQEGLQAAGLGGHRPQVGRAASDGLESRHV
jgi:flagellar biogenesis protein FliO